MVNIWYNLIIWSKDWIEFKILIDLNWNRSLRFLFTAFFWNIDFRFSIIKRNANFSALNCLAISIRLENIANCGSIFEWSIWNLNVNGIMLVCKCYEKFSSWESVKIVLNIFFIHWFFPNFLFFSSIINSLSEFVNVWICIHILPERFSVLWIISSSIGLFTSIIIKWNSSSG